MGLRHIVPILENDARIAIRRETWGHLAPCKNKSYRGHIVFAVGCYGDDELNPTILKASFKGLPDSPWLFDAMAEFISEGAKRKTGKVFCFDGVFRNYEFVGEIKEVWSAAERKPPR